MCFSVICTSFIPHHAPYLPPTCFIYSDQPGDKDGEKEDSDIDDLEGHLIYHVGMMIKDRCKWDFYLRFFSDLVFASLITGTKHSHVTRNWRQKF